MEEPIVAVVANEPVVLKSSVALNYLTRDYLAENANVKVVSSDGIAFKMNHLAMSSFSNLLYSILCDVWEHREISESIVISTNIDSSELRLIENFVTEGLLPHPAEELKASADTFASKNVFDAFGYNLVSLVKGERHCFVKRETEVHLQQDLIPQDLYGSNNGYNDMSRDVKPDLDSLSSGRRGRGRPPRGKRKNQDSSWYNEGSDGDQYLDDDNGDEYLVAEVKEEVYSDEDGEDSAWRPTFKSKKKHKKHSSKKVKKEEEFEDFIDDEGEVDADDAEYVQPSFQRDPAALIKQATKKTKIGDEEKVRGLMCVSKKNHFVFCSKTAMQKYQRELADYFHIQIAPPDFTEEDFNSVVFPEPVENYIVTPELLSDERQNWTTSTKHCAVCDQNFPSHKTLCDHFTTLHSLHYRCPYTDCDKTFSLGPRAYFLLARHYFYHSHRHPQLDYVHTCIECGYQSHLINCLLQHKSRMGPHHDNKCPRCHERFYTRAEYLGHMDQTGHYGYKCGLCEAVLETEELKKVHKRRDHYSKPGTVRPSSVICEDCGKPCKDERYLKQHKALQHGPNGKFPCEVCNKVCDTIVKLQVHKKQHIKRPCPICGKMIVTQKMKAHINTNHTEDSQRPHICSVCGKGFAVVQRLNDHMNIHTGARPHVCKFCGKGFASVGNKSMHERSSHLGYKRTPK